MLYGLASSEYDDRHGVVRDYYEKLKKGKTPELSKVTGFEQNEHGSKSSSSENEVNPLHGNDARASKEDANAFVDEGKGLRIKHRDNSELEGSCEFAKDGHRRADFWKPMQDCSYFTKKYACYKKPCILHGKPNVLIAHSEGQHSDLNYEGDVIRVTSKVETGVSKCIKCESYCCAACLVELASVPRNRNK